MTGRVGGVRPGSEGHPTQRPGAATRQITCGAALEALPPWLTAAASCGLTDLERFATGWERDQEAVHAALILPDSHGQPEGQITRLKLIKRSMYGRAKLDLLERRVLYRVVS